MQRFDDKGVVVSLTPYYSHWYMNYVLHPRIEDERWSWKFCRRFRLPYTAFVDLLAMVKGDNGTPYFSQWLGESDALKQKSPIELFLLGTLRYLGRGWTFDDLEEATAIGEETHRTFLHKFIEYGEDYLYETFVTIPLTAPDARSPDHEAAGTKGAMHQWMPHMYYDVRKYHMI